MPSFGTLKADTLTHSTAGSLATNYVVEGSGKCWFQISQGSTHTIDGSFNVASLTDGGAGETAVNFTNAMNDSNWSGNLTAQSSNNRNVMNNAPNTTRIKVEVYSISDNTAANDGDVAGVVHGDLA